MSKHPEKDNRNIMQESARIARGNVRAVTDLKVEDYDILIIPGGAGTCKNFSDINVAGPNLKIYQSIGQQIKDFYSSGKYIGVTHIAAFIVGKVLG